MFCMHSPPPFSVAKRRRKGEDETILFSRLDKLTCQELGLGLAENPDFAKVQTDA